MNAFASFAAPEYEMFLNAYGVSAEKADAISIFLPGILQKRYDAFRKQTRFVHYTSAEVAISIIRNQCVWLRNASAMNDYLELQHGMRKVTGYFHRNSPTGKLFWDRMDALHQGIAEEIRSLYDSWLQDLQMNTYMVCLSEHDSTEDMLGRLSMWRAYAPRNGVALVLNPQAFHNSSDALEAYSHPVLYYRDEEVKDVFDKIVSDVSTNPKLESFTRQEMIEGVFHMLEVFSLTLKHPGFEEEREWRVIYRPGQAAKKRIPSTVQVINGMPQRIYCLPLKDFEDEGLTGVTIPSLINKVIVGPSQYPLITWEAIVHELTEAKVPEAHLRVVTSDIPLRT